MRFIIGFSLIILSIVLTIIVAVIALTCIDDMGEENEL